jgi:hypothetical protein
MFAVSCVMVSCQTPARDGRSPHDWLIVPGVRIGPVHATSSERSLVELLGSEHVTRHELDVGEGFCAPGTVLYAGTADALAVTWIDSTYLRPALVHVNGRGSRWKTPAGVHVGMTLSALDSIAGGAPIQFGGFGWDYGGMAAWSEQTPQGRGQIAIQLLPDTLSDARARNDPRYAEIVGERTVTSHHPLIRAMTIHVDRILIRWNEPRVVRPCPDL